VHVGDTAARGPGSQRLSSQDVLSGVNEAVWGRSAMRFDRHEQSGWNKTVVDR